MEQPQNEIKSDNSANQIEDKKRKYSLTNNSMKSSSFSPNTKISKDYHLNNNMNSNSSTKKIHQKSYKEEKKSQKVITSMMEYQENINKNNIELLHKRYQKEIADIIKFELDKQLLKFKLNKEEEKFNKVYNNLNYKSLENKVILSKINKDKKELSKDKKEKKEQSNIINNEQKPNEKSKEKEKNNKNNNIGKILPPKPLKIINEKNFHENIYLMEQAKRQQIFEINELKRKKQLEKFEKMNKIKAEQNAMKKRIESERVTKNLQKNNYDLYLRKNNIEFLIYKKEFDAYHNKQKKKEELNNKIVKNKIMEQEKMDHIKKLRISEEKNRISFYLDLIKKEKSKEKKKIRKC